ncbi:serine--tRNA ligase [Candidatus Wolfebacteria bacterium]|nr:serine--tRNA ligase [Candidatus Wolfebacteria bacterium]
MLDIKFIQENRVLVEKAIADKKGEPVDLNKVLELYEKRKSLRTEIDGLNQERNKAAAERDVEEGRRIKDELKTLEEMYKRMEKEFVTLMIKVPNVPSPDTPVGPDESANTVLRTWGEKPRFSFDIKNHIELMQNLDMLDLERGAKVSGFRGYFLKNDAATLTYAIWHFVFHHMMQKGDFIPIITPALLKRAPFVGTGYLPQGEEDLYKTQDDLYLQGTAEVPTMAYYMDEVIEKGRLPIKFLSFSPSYRREAGSHGKDTTGIFRVHEIFKFEQVVLCEAKHDESVKYHEELTTNAEELVQALELPYQVVINATGDLGLGQVKKYDIETWVPSENKYRETHSSSYFHDFQTRRLGIRYRDENGKLRYAHSLNNTALSTPRILVSIVENYQQADGSIVVPEVLRSYIGKDVIQRIT